MIDYQPLFARLRRDAALVPLAEALPDIIGRRFSPARHGDIPRWQAVLDALPHEPAERIELNQDQVAARGSNVDSALLRQQLMGLHPWRKGPFHFHGVDIDTEWRSDWKWQRLAQQIDDLSGRRVLDVGCGSGYHCWRMAGAGAELVVGIDPTPLFIMQYWACRHFLGDHNVWVAPAGIEDMPADLRAFDTVFSMGVLYHRRSPLDHLLELRQCLRPGGQLVLETLVVDGPEGFSLTPGERYASMGNVWFIPSTATLLNWLGKMKFRNPRLIDLNTTSTDEQRSTEWMTFHSLAQFLDPNDPSRTLEGYPAPQRAVILAEAP